MSKQKKTSKRLTHEQVIRIAMKGMKESAIEMAIGAYMKTKERPTRPTLTNTEKYKVAQALADGKLVFRTVSGNIRAYERKMFVDMSSRMKADKPWEKTKKALAKKS